MNGSTCYWFAKRKMNNCSVCGWDCPEKCHWLKVLCAACFEEDMDAMYMKARFPFPACMAPPCRTKTMEQRAERDQAMNKESSAPMVKGAEPAVNSKAASKARPRQVGSESAGDPKMFEAYMRKKAEDKHMQKALREFEASYSMVEEAKAASYTQLTLPPKRTG